MKGTVGRGWKGRKEEGTEGREEDNAVRRGGGRGGGSVRANTALSCGWIKFGRARDTLILCMRGACVYACVHVCGNLRILTHSKRWCIAGVLHCKHCWLPSVLCAVQ